MVEAGRQRTAKTDVPVSRRGFLAAALAGLVTASLAGCAGSGQGAEPAGSAPSSGRDAPGGPGTGGKTLVAYFSAQGHTRRVAEAIAAEIGAELFEIVPAQPYTAGDLDWTQEGSRVNAEHDDERLRYVDLEQSEVDGWEGYGRVLLGYPIWWGIAAWPASTFAAENDFTGKTVVPFCTSTDSGIGSSGSLLAEEAMSGEWLDGHRFSSGAPDSEAAEWARSL
ncbi:MAG: flavodoxin [Coriobacteriales bacterium]